MEMAKPDMMKKIIFPYITHLGSRYGYICFFLVRWFGFSMLLTIKSIVFRMMYSIQKIASTFYDQGHLCSLLEAAINGLKVVLFYAETPLMYFHPVSKAISSAKVNIY